MSSEIKGNAALTEAEISLTQFAGGVDRGVCVQITCKAEGEPRYIQLTKTEARALVSCLATWLDGWGGPSAWDSRITIKEKVSAEQSAELLDACKALVNVFEATHRAQAGLRDFCVTDLQDALQLAQAAIAKAEKEGSR